MEPSKLVVARSVRSTLERNMGRILTMPAFLVPSMLIGVWVLGVYYAFTDFDIRYGIRNYVGYDNFVYLFTKDRWFWHSLGLTVRYAAATVLLELPLGFLVAILLERLTGWVQHLARAIVLTPMFVPPTVAVIIWKIALGPTQGVVNYVLERVGLRAVDWLGNPRVALLTMVAIDAWLWTPFVTIVLWGGLRSLPRVPYDSAAVDGASPWMIFRRITLPLMQPFLMIALLFRLCDSLNNADVIMGSTKGGPVRATLTYSVYTWEQAMGFNHMGYGAAMALIMFMVSRIIVKRLLKLWPS